MRKFTYYYDCNTNLFARFGFGQEPFISSNCPVTNCYVTDDRSLLSSISEYDAILFHARDMDKRVIQVTEKTKTVLYSNQI